LKKENLRKLMKEHAQIIDALGGTAKVAALCEVSPAAVSQWRENGIPKSRLMFLRLARPEVFGNDRRKKPRN
jgi:hypothetical protein